MSTAEPFVSIIMATFNRAHLIRETLNSIQQQLMTDWECIVIDDGSTDDTQIVISEFIEKDKRFSYHKRPGVHHKGLPGCRNYGLSLAVGSFIIFFDDDDLIHPQLLLLTTSYLQSNPQVTFCQYRKQSFTDQSIVNFPSYTSLTTDYFILLSDLDDIVQEKKGMASCTVLWKRECLNQRFDETLQYAEEWELYTRILSAGANGVAVKEVLYYNRKHAHSNTGEFWNGNKTRVDSKMKAAGLILKNLSSKNLLTSQNRNYLLNILIRNRGYSYLRQILNFCNFNTLEKIRTILYYLFFPVIFFFFKVYHRHAA